MEEQHQQPQQQVEEQHQPTPPTTVEPPSEKTKETTETPQLEEMKMVFCVRNDLRMGKGKIAAQCGHAAVECTLKSLECQKDKFQYWHEHDQTKVALRVDSLEQMFVFLFSNNLS